MANSANVPEDESNVVPIRRPPARSRERRVQQLVGYAEDLLEQRLLTGTASPTETVAILRLGTENEQVTNDRIRAQTEYLHAQRAKAESETVREELFTQAMEAMKRYSPDGD